MWTNSVGFFFYLIISNVKSDWYKKKSFDFRESFCAHSEANWKHILDQFNSLKNKENQDKLLASMIKVCNVARRRSRKDLTNQEGTSWHHKSLKYFIRNSEGSEKEVCINRFCAIFGVGKNRVWQILKHNYKTQTCLESLCKANIRTESTNSQM